MVEHFARDRHHHRQASGERGGFEHIEELTCWALLASTPVGRVGVVVDGAAEIYPVDHVVDRHPNGALTVVFRTDPGTKLAGLAGTPGVCFEVDGVDPEHHSGWSALAVMERDRIIEPAALIDTVHQMLPPAGPERGR